MNVPFVVALSAISSLSVDLEPAKRGESIKPGVERSVTPG